MRFQRLALEMVLPVFPSYIRRVPLPPLKAVWITELGLSLAIFSNWASTVSASANRPRLANAQPFSQQDREFVLPISGGCFASYIT